ncbi:MAG: response regulator [Desulfobulbaceae bacterium]
MTEKKSAAPGRDLVEERGGAASREQLRALVHDLNNILSVIQLSAHSAAENLAEGMAAEDELREIQAAVGRGRELLRGLSVTAGDSEPGPIRHVRPEGVQTIPPGGPAPEPGKGKRILFIDDEPELAQLGQRLLAKKGYQVSLFTSSLEAFAVFTADPQAFDLVVTDQNMPGLNGIELASRILTIRPEIPILVCTGYSTGFSRWNFRDYGFCDLLVKPYQPAELLSAVRTIFA